MDKARLDKGSQIVADMDRWIEELLDSAEPQVARIVELSARPAETSEERKLAMICALITDLSIARRIIERGMLRGHSTPQEAKLAIAAAIAAMKCQRGQSHS